MSGQPHGGIAGAGFHPVVLHLFVLAISLGGCATTSPPRFENSNQMFLKRTIHELDLGSKLTPLLPSGSKVALVSLERPETRDHPVSAILEDQLIPSLIERGFVVLERDQDALLRLVEEKSGDRFRLTYLPSDVLISSVGRSAGVTQVGMLGSGFVSGGASLTEIAGAGRDTVIVFETHLDPADYLISYRVLECGIIYRKGSYRETKREAMVGLHVRLQDTHSGKILYANNVRSTLEDEVPRDQLEDLEEFRYSLYSHDYPLVRGTPKGRREVAGSTRGSGKGALLVVGGLLVAGLIAAQ